MSNNLNRRSFLKNSVASAVAGSSMLSSFAGLNRLSAAVTEQSALKAADEYRALVCIFLHGGNDGFNVLIPRDIDNYSIYQASRQNLAVPQQDLLAVTPASGGDFGFNPAMPEIQSLFQSGKLAMQSNVGTLVEPVTRDQIIAKTVALPPQLFSHNDQQALWETAYADGPTTAGWGGLIADLVDGQNNSPISMNISISGNNLFQVGMNNAPYSMNASGVNKLAGVNHSVSWEQQRAAVFQRIRDLSSTHILETEHRSTVRNTQETADLLSTALESSPDLITTFPEGNSLAEKLEMVARMISIREILGFQRQIFFVSMGGFDTHDRQNIDQPSLLSGLSQAMDSFYQVTEELGLANQVTSFTLSDFGRTLTSNGDGTDHGWGSHHMIMGGAVNGGDIYGTIPELAIGGPDDAGDGRLIPTTSVEQYSATIARWFGLSESELDQVFPNLANFNSSDMGFMNNS